MSYWQEMPGRLVSTIVNLSGGVQTGFPPIDVPEDQALNILNLGPQDYPALSTRPGMDNYGTKFPASPNGIFELDGVLYAGYQTYLVKWNGSDWDLDHPLKSDLGNAQDIEATKFMDLGIFTDQSHWYKISGGVVSLLGGNPPVGKYVTVHANRLYLAGLTAHPSGMAHCALRQPEDWITADDAGLKYMDTPDSEVVTGITTAFDHVICFKPHWMFELYGTGPINYQFVQGPPGVGCISNRTIVLLDRALYWLGDRKVFAYKGGSAPEDISVPISKYMQNMREDMKHLSCAGTDGIRYFLSIPIGLDIFPNVTLVYDPRVNAWYVWETEQPLDMLLYQNKPLLADASGQVIHLNPAAKLDFDTDQIQWYRESKAFTAEPDIRHQSLWKLGVLAELGNNATLTTSVSGQASGETWTGVSTILGPTSGFKRTRIDVPAKAVADKDFLRIQLSGIGNVKLHRLEKTVRVKGV